MISKSIKSIGRVLSVLTLTAIAMASHAAMAQEAGVEAPVKWGVECNTQECKSVLRLPIDNGPSQIEIWVAKIQGGKSYLGVITPLGIHIPSGVLISFDKGKSAYAKMNLIDCTAIGCRSILSFEPKLAEKMKKGNDIAVIVRDSKSRKAIGLLATLDGFTSSLAEMNSRQPAKVSSN